MAPLMQFSLKKLIQKYLKVEHSWSRIRELLGAVSLNFSYNFPLELYMLMALVQVPNVSIKELTNHIFHAHNYFLSFLATAFASFWASVKNADKLICNCIRWCRKEKRGERVFFWMAHDEFFKQEWMMARERRNMEVWAASLPNQTNKKTVKNKNHHKATDCFIF